MQTAMIRPPFKQFRLWGRTSFLLLGLWFAGTIIYIDSTLTQKQTANPSLPYGVFCSSGTVSFQDFSYNLLYFKGIQEHIVAHPYRLKDQIQLTQHFLPQFSSGMSHAYSPVAFVLAHPFLLMSGRAAYLTYSALITVGTLLLFHFYLLPRVHDPLQLCALMACAISVGMMGTLAVGQTATLTTALLGALAGVLFWKPVKRPLLLDLVLALLFWALCLKPSLTFIPLFILLGARAWRPLALGAVLLTITWCCTANAYGGFWTGLQDYLYLLNHYNTAQFPSMRISVADSTFEPPATPFLFSLKRDLILVISLVLLFLRWKGRIDGSGQFQGLVWVFLLLSPYLLASEDWVMCLLVVEGTFFMSGNPIANYGKLFLLMGIFDLRAHLTTSKDIDYELKLLLFAWMAAEWLLRRAGVDLGRWHSDLSSSRHRLTRSA